MDKTRPPSADGYSDAPDSADSARAGGIADLWVVRWKGDTTDRDATLREAADVAFDTVPVHGVSRVFARRRRPPGLYWSATTSDHVPVRSRVAAEHMLALDRAPSTAGLSGSPFVLTFHGDDDGPATSWRHHTPDFFVRLADGSVLVVDCRGPGVVPSRLSIGQAAMKRAAAAVGWAHEIRGPLSPGFARNLCWLAGYRHPRFARLAASHRASTRSVLPRPRALLDTATLLGDPIITLPVLFHLLWTGTVLADLENPLGPQSRISWKGQR